MKLKKLRRLKTIKKLFLVTKRLQQSYSVRMWKWRPDTGFGFVIVGKHIVGWTLDLIGWTLPDPPHTRPPQILPPSSETEKTVKKLEGLRPGNLPSQCFF